MNDFKQTKEIAKDVLLINDICFGISGKGARIETEKNYVRLIVPAEMKLHHFTDEVYDFLSKRGWEYITTSNRWVLDI